MALNPPLLDHADLLPFGKADDAASKYHGAFALSTDAQVTPLPSSLLLLTAGVAGLLGLKPKSRRRKITGVR